MTTLEQKKTPEKGFFDDITKGLKDLMNKITGGINEILVSLGLKKKEEINKESEKTKLDLKEFSKTIEDKYKSKEKLEKSNEYFKNLKFIKEKFGEEIYQKEIENILSLFKYGEFNSDGVLDRLNEKKDLEITENQSKFILGILEKDQEYIKENTPSIVIVIENIKGEESIHDIVKAHKKLTEKEQEISTETIKKEIEKNKEVKDPEGDDLENEEDIVDENEE